MPRVLRINSKKEMKKVKVTAAIIEKDEKILIARRNYGDFAGYWEFPGGKYEEGETGQEAIIREIREEFDTQIEVKEYLCTVEHQYDTFYLIMDCYICKLFNDDLVLHDHSAIRWIDPFEENINYLPADQKVIREYRRKTT